MSAKVLALKSVLQPAGNGVGFEIAKFFIQPVIRVVPTHVEEIMQLFTTFQLVSKDHKLITHATLKHIITTAAGFEPMFIGDTDRTKHWGSGGLVRVWQQWVKQYYDAGWKSIGFFTIRCSMEQNRWKATRVSPVLFLNSPAGCVERRELFWRNLNNVKKEIGGMTNLSQALMYHMMARLSRSEKWRSSPYAWVAQTSYWYFAIRDSYGELIVQEDTPETSVEWDWSNHEPYSTRRARFFTFYQRGQPIRDLLHATIPALVELFMTLPACEIRTQRSCKYCSDIKEHWEMNRL